MLNINPLTFREICFALGAINALVGFWLAHRRATRLEKAALPLVEGAGLYERDHDELRRALGVAVPCRYNLCPTRCGCDGMLCYLPEGHAGSHCLTPRGQAR